MMLSETAVVTLTRDLKRKPLEGGEMREVEAAKSQVALKVLYVSLVDPIVGMPGYMHIFTQTVDGYTRHFYEEIARRG